VNGVEAIGVEVVWKSTAASDSTDPDEALPGDPEVGQDALNGGKDRVVSATWTPADLLTADEVFAGQLMCFDYLSHDMTANSRLIRASSSSTPKGLPCTFPNEVVEMRYVALRTCAS